MSAGPVRTPRADARRNADKITRAARAAFAEQGIDTSLELIARQAGVSAATLYRRFPDRGGLVIATLELAIAENLSAELERAADHPDPWRGFVETLESVMTFADQERELLKAANDAGVLVITRASPLVTQLTDLMLAAQSEHRVRGDVGADDVPRILVMLLSCLPMVDPGSGDWRRYLGFVLDGLAPRAAEG